MTHLERVGPLPPEDRMRLELGIIERLKKDDELWEFLKYLAYSDVARATIEVIDIGSESPVADYRKAAEARGVKRFISSIEHYRANVEAWEQNEKRLRAMRHIEQAALERIEGYNRSQVE